MNTRKAIALLGACILLSLGLPCAADGGKTPAATSAPAKPKLQWGETKAGLQLSISAEGQAAVGGKLILLAAFRNVGSLGVQLGPEDKAFAWLAIAHSREEAWLSAKVAVADLLAAWPAKLEGGKTVAGEAYDASVLTAYPYSFRKQILENYLGYANASKLPPAAGKLGSLMSEGKVTVICRLYVKRPGQKGIIVSSNKLAIEVAPPLLESMTPQERKAYLGALAARFDKDAWSGQAAHAVAVEIGKPAVSLLIKAVNETSRPVHARMWLATALADIRDERAAEALIPLLQDSLGGVRHVVAYHGPKQRSKKLDAAIVARTLKLKESRMTALAMLGFLVFRGEVNDRLLTVSLESSDPKVRATAVAALAKHASVDNLRRLMGLVKDKDEKVRGAAASALGAMGRGGVKVTGALIAALDIPGDSAKYKICKALIALTGEQIVFDPQASAEEKARAVAKWKNWWRHKHVDKVRQ